MKESVIVLILFTYGAIVSSFGSVVAQRLPRGESLIRGRSHCNQCDHVLVARDLLPIVSWLLTRGKCRYCARPLSIRYPLFEAIGGGLWAATYGYTDNWPQFVGYVLFWTFLLIVVQTDLLYKRVPNRLTFPGAAFFLVLSVCTGIQTPLGALLGAAVNVGVLFLLIVVSRGKMGAGDMKLYASIGAVLGPWLGLTSLVLASFSGSIVGIGLRLAGLIKKREYIAFVPHITVGVIISVFWGHELLKWYLNLSASH